MKQGVDANAKAFRLLTLDQFEKLTFFEKVAYVTEAELHTLVHFQKAPCAPDKQPWIEFDGSSVELCFALARIGRKCPVSEY